MTAQIKYASQGLVKSGRQMYELKQRRNRLALKRKMVRHSRNAKTYIFG